MADHAAEGDRHEARGQDRGVREAGAAARGRRRARQEREPHRALSGQPTLLADFSFYRVTMMV